MHMQQPTKSHFIGDLSPQSNPLHYLSSIRSLHEWYWNHSGTTKDGEAARPPLVINTHGWIKVCVCWAADAMLCCAVLCCAVLCCAVLCWLSCCATLYARLCYAVPCHALLYAAHALRFTVCHAKPIPSLIFPAQIWDVPLLIVVLFVLLVYIAVQRCAVVDVV